MTRGLLQRLRRMDRDELVFRARVAAQTQAGRLASAWRPRRWDRASLAVHLRGISPDTRDAAERLRAGDWEGAHTALIRHLIARPPSFPVPPSEFGRVAGEVGRRFPGAARDARDRADRVLDGRFDLLGYEGLRFGDNGGAGSPAIDWHLDPVHGRRAPRDWWSRVPYLDPSCGDHKIIWELNRHQHWLALARAAWLTGDGRYRAEFIRQLRHWLDENQPFEGINWASMLELSLRCLVWVWALHAFAPLEPGASNAAVEEPAWTLDMLLGIREQMDHVERNLSTYFSPNTHLTGEALGLYVCGRALPELDVAPRWAATGRRVLLEQIDRQVLADGGHCERSTHYHRYTLDFYLLALAVARATGDACARPLAAAAGRLAEAARLLADQRGRVPALGDDDGGSLFPICRRSPSDIRDSLATAAVLLDRPDLAAGPAPEEPLWLIGDTTGEGPGGGAPGPVRFTSGALPDTGYFVSRTAPGSHVVIDGGPHGYLNGGHAHADALSLTMAIDGRPVMIDPGTGSYTVSPSWRDRFRSTPLHNTLTLGGRSQSTPAGPFHWRTAARTAVQRWFAGGGLDYFEGVHDGYHPLVHRRRVVALRDGVVVVVDSLTGATTERVRVHWHIDPSWQLGAREQDGGQTLPPARDGGPVVRLAHPSGARHWLALLGGEVECFRGDEQAGLGWHSPAYGRITPSTTLRISGIGRLPTVIVSVFGWTSGDGEPPLVTLIPGEIDRRLPAGEDDSIGVRIARESVEDLLLFAYRPPLMPGDVDAGDETSRPALAAFDADGERIETDGRFVHVTKGRPGEAVRAALLDGGHVRSSRAQEPLVSGTPARGWTAGRATGRGTGVG